MVGLGLLSLMRVTSGWKGILTVVAAVLVVGTCWELFEYYGGVVDRTEPGLLLDTTIDYIMNVKGALAAYALSRKL